MTSPLRFDFTHSTFFFFCLTLGLIYSLKPATVLHHHHHHHVPLHRQPVVKWWFLKSVQRIKSVMKFKASVCVWFWFSENSGDVFRDVFRAGEESEELRNKWNVCAVSGPAPWLPLCLCFCERGSLSGSWTPHELKAAFCPSVKGEPDVSLQTERESHMRREKPGLLTAECSTEVTAGHSQNSARKKERKKETAKPPTNLAEIQFVVSVCENLWDLQ